MKTKEDYITRFAESFQRLIMKMNEVDDFCLQMTEAISKQDLSLVCFINDQREVTMGEIANYLEVPLSTATWIVDKLVANGYLTRYTSEHDRRRVKVILDKKGKKLAQLFNAKKNEMSQRILSKLKKDEIDNLINIMEKIAAKLKINGDF